MAPADGGTDGAGGERRIAIGIIRHLVHGGGTKPVRRGPIAPGFPAFPLRPLPKWKSYPVTTCDTPAATCTRWLSHKIFRGAGQPASRRNVATARRSAPRAASKARLQRRRRQAEHRFMGPEIRGGMRLECQDAPAHAMPRGFSFRHLQQLLVTTMQAIEIADGNHTPLQIRCCNRLRPNLEHHNLQRPARDSGAA
jgi:hypothetical protein